MSLAEKTDAIVSENRHAGHAWTTVWAALNYARDQGVNGAYVRLRRLKERGVPQWLIKRWARDAGLIESTPAL